MWKIWLRNNAVRSNTPSVLLCSGGSCNPPGLRIVLLYKLALVSCYNIPQGICGTSRAMWKPVIETINSATDIIHTRASSSVLELSCRSCEKTFGFIIIAVYIHSRTRLRGCPRKRVSFWTSPIKVYGVWCVKYRRILHITFPLFYLCCIV